MSACIQHLSCLLLPEDTVSSKKISCETDKLKVKMKNGEEMQMSEVP